MINSSRWALACVREPESYEAALKFLEILSIGRNGLHEKGLNRTVTVVDICLFGTAHFSTGGRQAIDF
jgi:hypothetical protein